MSLPTIKQLFENNVHFGHKASKRHPMMSPYIWGVKHSVSYIDLDKTRFLLDYACKQLEEILAQGGQVLWVGTKRQAQKAIQSAGEAMSMPYVAHRWIGGTLTNFDQVKKAVTRLLHMREVIKKPMPHLKKKEISMLKKEADRLEKNVSGIVELRGTPSVVVAVDATREATAIYEAKRAGVPVISIVDTNTNPSLVDVIIPANDDAASSVEILVQALVEAAQRGLARAALAEKERPGKDLKAKKSEAVDAAGSEKVEEEADEGEEQDKPKKVFVRKAATPDSGVRKPMAAKRPMGPKKDSGVKPRPAK